MRLPGLIVIIVLLAGSWNLPGEASANTFACCLPDGTCDELIISACEDRGGISTSTFPCSPQACAVVAAPIFSLPALLLVATSLLTLAIYTLMRRHGGRR